MWKNSNTLKSIIALTLGILFAVVIAEFFLQILDFPTRPVSGWQSCEKLSPGQCNAMGFRGKEIAYSDNDFVVILLGDSEAYAAASPLEQIPERRLEHFLQEFKKDVKVFTLADMGYGQDQQYLALKLYFEKYRADLVLLMFTARNDIVNNISPTAGKNNTIKPTFWLENNELQGPTEKWLKPAGPLLKLVLLWEVYSGKYDGELRNKIWEEKILPPNSQRSERMQYGIDLTRKLFLKMKELTETNNGHFIIFKEERPEELQDSSTVQPAFINSQYDKKSKKQYQENLKKLFGDFEHYRIPLNLDNYRRSPSNSHLNEQAINKLMKELSLIISRKDYFQ